MIIIIILCTFLLCVAPAYGVIAIEDVCSGTSNNDEPFTADNCTVTGSNTYIACQAATARTTFSIVSVTWDVAGANEALSLITSTNGQNTGRVNTAWYGLKNPTPGTNKSVTADISSTGVSHSLHCQMFSGVDQTTPVSGGTTHTTDTSTPTINVTSATNDLVVGGVVVNNENGSTNLAVGSGETLRTGPTLTTRGVGDEDLHQITMTEPGSASVTIAPTWTTSASQVLSGFSLKAASATRTYAPIVIISQ